MKIALLLSGHCRTYDYTFPSFKKWILDPLQPDVFFHTWSDRWVDKSVWHAPNGECVELPNEKTSDELVSLYKPKSFELELQQPLDESYRGSLYMTYGWQAVGRLVKEYQRDRNMKYDVIIRTRFDVFFKYFDTNELNDLSSIAAPRYGGFGAFGGINDMFGFSSCANMLKYCDFHDVAREEIGKEEINNPSVALGRWIRQSIPTRVSSVQLDLVRRGNVHFDFEGINP